MSVAAPPSRDEMRDIRVARTPLRIMNVAIHTSPAASARMHATWHNGMQREKVTQKQPDDGFSVACLFQNENGRKMQQHVVLNGRIFLTKVFLQPAD